MRSNVLILFFAFIVSSCIFNDINKGDETGKFKITVGGGENGNERAYDPLK
jgi:hypothetical protein